MRKIKIGVIGLGSIGTYKHLPSSKECGNFEITALCDIDTDKLSKTAGQYGVPEKNLFTDYNDLINCADVEVVDICTSNDLHFPMAMAAVNAGKPYCLEKPITLDAAEADRLAEHTIKSGLKNMVCFSYRYIPAARYARELIRQGKIGELHHVNMEYSQGWGRQENNKPLVWRFSKKHSGSGTLADLGSHGIDLARFVTGKDYKRVTAHADTIIKQRVNEQDGTLADVDVDDFCNALAEMEDGVSATFHFTRFGAGRKNYQRMEIYGSTGSIIYDILKENSLEVCGKAFSDQEEFIEIDVPEEFKKEQMQSLSELLNNVDDGLNAGISDGRINQHVIDAMLDSNEKKCWVDITL